MNTSSSFRGPDCVSCVAPPDITSTTEAAFQSAVTRAVDSAPSGWRTLLIDLQATRLIDSKGLNLIVSIVKNTRASGREVRFVAPRPTVRRILAFTRLDRHASVVNLDGSSA